MGTPYSNSCNAVIRKFYDDFDLLPAEFKELIWDSPTTPDLDDLKIVWELAQNSGSLNKLIEQVNCLKQPLSPKKKKKHQKEYKIPTRPYNETHAILGKPRLKDIDPKHARLVKRVSEEEAMKLLCSRKENKDIKPHSDYYRPILGYKQVVVQPTVDDTRIPPKKDHIKHIAKMLHNAGGKGT